MGRVTEIGDEVPQAPQGGDPKARAQEELQLSLLAQRLAPVEEGDSGTRQTAKRPAARRRPKRRKRRRAAPRSGRLALRLGGGGTALLLCAAAVAWVWPAGWLDGTTEQVSQAFYAATADAGLTVDEILAEGRDRTGKSDILTALGAGRGSPILAVSPATAKARLERLPWVRRATVERRLPQTLYVRIEERTPIALWQRGGKLSVIDQGGETIPAAALTEFAHLPIVVGEDAPQHAGDLLSMLAVEPDLVARVTAAVRVGGRRWSVRLDDVIDIHLPMDNPGGAWAKLATMNRRHAVLGRDVQAIDLRLPDRMVVRMAPGATMAEELGKDT